MIPVYINLKDSRKVKLYTVNLSKIRWTADGIISYAFYTKVAEKRLLAAPVTLFDLEKKVKSEVTVYTGADSKQLLTGTWLSRKPDGKCDIQWFET